MKLNFARNNLHTDRQQACFIDEFQICYKSKPNKQIIRDRRRKFTGTLRRTYIKSKGSAGCSIMVCVAFSMHSKMPLALFINERQQIRGHGPPVIINLTCTAQSFTNIVIPTLAEWYHQNNLNMLILDGASCHVDAGVQTLMREHHINFIPFAGRGSHFQNGYPPNSNDYNIAENVIAEIKNRVWTKQPTCQRELIQYTQQVWDELEVGFFESLFESIPNRLQEAIRLQGYKTHY